MNLLQRGIGMTMAVRRRLVIGCGTRINPGFAGMEYIGAGGGLVDLGNCIIIEDVVVVVVAAVVTITVVAAAAMANGCGCIVQEDSSHSGLVAGSAKVPRQVQFDLRVGEDLLEVMEKHGGNFGR